ncbi:MAG: hypothetical protein ACREBB_10795 [Nitrosotalea sp.]
MKNKLLVPSGVFAIFILFAISSGVPIFADGTAQQSISANTHGFAFTDICCPDVSLNLNGNITTGTDGTMELSQQNGNIVIGSTDYKLQFTPSDKITAETVGDDCSSGITYQQDGEISLVGNDGTVIKGSGEYSWGAVPDCSSDKHSFTNFSGKVQDLTGQTTEFYTGTDLLPDIQ